MDLMHDAENAPNISRPGYGDSITSLSLLAGVMAALFIRERTGIGQAVEASLYNTATWVLGSDIDAGHHPQVLVPPGHWQRARPRGTEASLVSCVVVPGFDFADFVLGL